MQFIPTTPAKVKILKKQAKRLKCDGSGQHVDMLDHVARANGYDHWHHVTQCLAETTQANSARGITKEIEGILDAERAGQSRIVGTGPEATTAQPLLLFSSGIGDAWLLDPIGNQATCLMWRGERQSPTIRDLPTRLEIEWDGTFELRGPFFEVTTDHPDIGARAIAGYPLDELRSYIDQAHPIERKIAAIFDQDEAVPLSPEIMTQLMRTGWDEAALQKAARQGARYDPQRNTVLFPPVSER
jgi:hypothetical protein